VCKQYGDCCDDKEDVCNVADDGGSDDSSSDDGGTDGGDAPETALTCADSCGVSDAVTDGDKECFCDELCTDYGDCCGDYQQECAS
jgi:hypothetical protein